MHTQTRDQKIAVAAQKMAHSPAFSELMVLSPEQWAEFLRSLDESIVDDCLLILKEEAQTYEEIEKKRQRRHESNKNRLLATLKL